MPWLELQFGLAGFSGVIAGFLQRDGLSPADRIRFLALFGSAFAALVLAFVPIALAYSGFKNQDIWQISSATMVFALLVGLVPFPFGQRTIRKEFKTTTLLPTVFLLVPSGINLAIQLVNAGGWIWQPNLVPYLIGMLVYLYAIAFFFVVIVLFRPTA